MYAGIEATLKKETVLTCALVLSTYTEILGGFVTGKLKIERNSRQNYEAFLQFLGNYYVQLNWELQKRGTNLHREVRSKIVHEYQPRPGFAFTLEDEATDKPGIEYPSLGDGQYSLLKDKSLNIPPPRFLVFRAKEYYRDFRNAVDNYESAINSQLQSTNRHREGSLVFNLQKVITVRAGDH